MFDSESSRPESYRGQDRRRLVSEATPKRSRPFVVGGLILLTTWIAVGALSTGTAWASIDSDLLNLEFDTAAVALAVFAGTLCIVYRNLVGGAPVLWMGTGLLVYGVGTIGLGEVLVSTGAIGVDTDVIGWLRPASIVVVLALFTMALRAPEVDATLDARKVVLFAFGATAVLTLALQLMPALSAAVSGSAEPIPPSSRSGWAAGVIALVWVYLATMLALNGWRSGQQIFLWMSTLMFGLTFSETTRALGAALDGEWATGAALLRAVAVLLGVVGITRELQSIFAVQTERLFHTHTQARAHEERYHHHLAEQEERAHEARNALAAIEGAVVTLERHRERLDEISQRALSRALSSEIAHLQRLVSSEAASSSYRIAFDPDEVIKAQVELARSQGALITVDLQPDLRAYGRPANVAEALQNLLVNARVHAGGSSITVQARQEGEWVVIRVFDAGPGIGPDYREEIFRRGGRASAAPGSGLGLYLSRQLMQEQGGDLCFEETDGVGACFALKVAAANTELSAADVERSRAELADHTLDRSNVIDHDVPLAQTGTDAPDASARGRVGQAEDDVDGDPLR